MIKIISISVLLIGLLGVSLSAFSKSLMVEDSIQFVHHDSTVLSFISDTQAPLFFEKLLLKTNHNKEATEQLLTAVLQQKPRYLFFLGDIINIGSNAHRWRKMQGWISLLNLQQIGTRALIGNHEYLWRKKAGIRNLKKHFPTASSIGEVCIIDSVAVVLLNSNFKQLSKQAIKAQDEWYSRTLKELQASSSIRAIIVACHHSPFSNSKIVGSSAAVQQHFLTPFYATSKCCLFVSGHAHDFEYFESQQKLFLVIGGGGGPHHPLAIKADSPIELAPNYNPLFHYLRLVYHNGRLRIQSYY